MSPHHRLRWLALVAVCGSASCFEGLTLDQVTDPPDPTFIVHETTCTDGVMTYSAVVESEVDLSNLVLERAIAGGAALDPLFPTLDENTFGGEITQWELEVEHDCAESVATTWTAWTPLETSATVETAWPDLDLGAGAVEPAHGSDAGGSTVVVSGTQMDAVTAVWFGDAEATIVSATEEAVTVTTPPGSPGLVDVTIEAGVSTEVAAEAFTYWPDASGQMSGLTRMVLQIYDTRWFTIGSAYTTLSPYGPFAQHEAVLHVPDDPSRSFPNVFPPVGDCTTEHDFGWSKLSVGSYLTLENDDLGALPMVATGAEAPNYYYVESDITPADWSGQVFDMELLEASAYTPPMVVADAALLPTLPTDPSFDWHSADSVVFGEDLRFTWTDTSAERVWWTVFPARGTTALGDFSCMADATTGGITIPWEQVTDGIDTSRITSFLVRLGFHEDVQSPMLHDNSAVWALGEVNYWVYLSVTPE